MQSATRESITAELKEFIVNTFPRMDDEELSESDQLLEEGIVDSLGILEIVAYIQTNYNVRVNDEDITAENFDTVKNIAEYITGKLA